MAEIDDVVPGEPIEASWGNPIRDRTVQRYATAAERDVENPIPTAGDLAYLEDTFVVQFFTGADWVILQTVGTGNGQWLRIDSTNGPIGPGLVTTPPGISGTIQEWSGDGVGDGFRRYRWRRGADFGNLELVAVNSDQTETLIMRITGTGIVTYGASSIARTSATLSAEIRNTHQSLNVDPTTQGIDGDVWLTYS